MSYINIGEGVTTNQQNKKGMRREEEKKDKVTQLPINSRPRLPSAQSLDAKVVGLVELAVRQRAA